MSDALQADSEAAAFVAGHPQPDRHRKGPIWILNSDKTQHARIQYDDGDMGLGEKWFAADYLEGWTSQPVLATRCVPFTSKAVTV